MIKKNSLYLLRWVLQDLAQHLIQVARLTLWRFYDLVHLIILLWLAFTLPCLYQSCGFSTFIRVLWNPYCHPCFLFFLISFEHLSETWLALLRLGRGHRLTQNLYLTYWRHSKQLFSTAFSGPNIIWIIRTSGASTCTNICTSWLNGQAYTLQLHFLE